MAEPSDPRPMALPVEAPQVAALTTPPDEAPRAAQPARTWIIGSVAFLGLIGASIVSVGLAAIVWVPLFMGIGIAMIVVAAARRRRQTTQGRNGNEIKDPRHAHPRWPSNVVDDRLPEP
jgi:hypothetical protein